MVNRASESEIEAFRSEWTELTQKSTNSPLFVRMNLDNAFTKFLNDVKAGSDVEAITDSAEELKAELSNTVTISLESASSTSFHQLIDDISNSIKSDYSRPSTDSLDDIIRDSIDENYLENKVEEADYEIGPIKSDLFRDISRLSNKREARSINTYQLKNDVENYKSILESYEFKKNYRDELVEKVEVYLSEGELDESLDDIVSELVGELRTIGWNGDSLEEVIENLETTDTIDEFCDVLRGEKYLRKYCVPLPSDHLLKSHMKVAGVDFYMEDDSEFTYLDDIMEYDERLKQTIELMASDTNFYAILQVVAPTHEIGEKKMEQKLERAIDALNYRQKIGVVQSPFLQSQTNYICKDSNGQYKIQVSNHEKYGFQHSFRETENNMDLLEEQFDFFNTPEEERTPLENRFIQSYRWYGDGIQSGIPEEELLKYVVAIESMLVPEEYGVKNKKVARRLSDIRGVYKEDRDSYQDSIIELYNTRNKIVHTAEIDIPNIDTQIELAHRSATNMYGMILELYIDEYDEISELLDHLSEKDVPENSSS